MEFAVINVPAAPVRRKPRHSKEMVNQLLFGETIELLKTKEDLWVKIRSMHDGYEGWMTNTLFETIDEAVSMAKEAIELYLESLVAHGEIIPTEENTFEYSVSVVA